MRSTGMILPLFCIALGAGGFAVAPRDVTPQAVADDFYALYLNAKIMGVPGEQDRAKLHDLITPSLDRALASADAAERQYAIDTENEVPPLVEGDLFSSLFEGASSYKVGDCSVSGTQAQCPVDLSYRDGASSPATKWQDTLVLTQLPQLGWRISDIVYGGAWKFAKKDQLTRTLKDVVWDAKSVSQ